MGKVKQQSEKLHRILVMERVGWLLWFCLGIGGCIGPTDFAHEEGGIANELEINAAVDEVHLLLSHQECRAALNRILPLYNSRNSNNAVRLATAASYGCSATINLIKILNDFILYPNFAGGLGIWEFFAQEFPSISSPDDKIPQAAMNGTDALQAALAKGVIVVPALGLNSAGYNPMSLAVNDRISVANAYLMFMSMALVGSLENRYGLPTANHHKSVDLPWVSAVLTQGDGCAFASGILNFSDGLGVNLANAPAGVIGQYLALNSFLAANLDTSCALGCLSCVASGVTCTTCPTTLRNRSSCLGLATDVNSCAAAGIVSFVNASWSGPP